MLDREGFDAFVEKQCARFYPDKMGRPGLTPGVCFRSLMIGWFEGIEDPVADRVYHSGAVLEEIREKEVRTCIPEKKQAGKRHWKGKEKEQQVVCRNRQDERFRPQCRMVITRGKRCRDLPTTMGTLHALRAHPYPKCSMLRRHPIRWAKSVPCELAALMPGWYKFRPGGS